MIVGMNGRTLRRNGRHDIILAGTATTLPTVAPAMTLPMVAATTP